jgi:hypothetical protein
MRGSLLGPKLVSDLRERFVVEVRDVVQAAVDQGDFLLRQFKGDSFLPKLVERKVIA